MLKKPNRSQIMIARLIELYTKTEARIVKEITRKHSLGLVDYADVAALERVRAILADMTGKTEEIAPSLIESYFKKAAEMGAGYVNAAALTTTQTQITENLINNLMVDIEEAAETAYKTAEDFLVVGRLEADKFRETNLENNVARLAEGQGWQTIQNKLVADLQAQGLTSFIDKAGRKWGLSAYCAMATRTTARQAQVAATLTEDDWDLWQISKIGTTCPICAAYEGRVYSKSGNDPNYPPLASAFSKIDPLGSNDLTNTYLNLHPGCLHTLVRYTTAGKTEEQIQADKDFSSFEKRPPDIDYRTKAQAEAYRDKERQRAKYRNDMKQYRTYKAALGGKDFPKTFETFMKHKNAGDEKFAEWRKRFTALKSPKETFGTAPSGYRPKE